MIHKIIYMPLFILLFAVTELFSAQGYMGVGYTSLQQQNDTQKDNDGYTLDMGVRFDTTIKQRAGMEYLYTNISDFHSGVGNSINFYYEAGYEIFTHLVVMAKVGYSFEEVDRIGSGSTSTGVYAHGLCYGAGGYYDITRNWSVALEYTTFDLSYDLFSTTLDHDFDAIGVKVFYNF